MARLECVAAALALWLAPGAGAVEPSFIARGDPEPLAAFMVTLPSPSDRGELAPEYPYTADGFTAAWCGAVLVIEPASDGAGLAAMLPAPSDRPPRELALELAKLLAVDGGLDRERAAPLVAALTVPDLMETVRLAGELRSGRLYVQASFEEPLPGEQLAPSLRVCWPAPGPMADPVDLFWRESSYDFFAEELAKAKGLISVGEYRERVLLAAAKDAARFPEDARLDERLTTSRSTAPADAVAAAVAARSGTTLRWLPTGAPPIITMELRDVPLREALEALAWVTNTSLEPLDGGHALRGPDGLRERLTVATPLGWLAPARRDKMARMAAEQNARRLTWTCLATEDRGRLAAGALVADLSPATRAAVETLVGQRLARRWAQLLSALPTRSGPLSCRLDRAADKVAFELVTPGWSHRLRGALALQLLGADGQDWVPLSVAAPGEDEP